MERLAIPPFENLSDDRSLAWAGRALSEVASAEITGSAHIQPLPVASARESALGGATSALRGYFTLAGGRLRLSVSREDLSSGRVTGTFTGEDAFPGGLFRLAGALARWIDPNARAFDTQSVSALESYAEGLEAAEPGEQAACFERSVAADPNFGAPYVAWARSLVARGDRAGAQGVIERVRARGNQMAEARRAELDLLASALAGDPAGRRRALLVLGRVMPADAGVFRQLASEDMAARRYDAAADSWRRATALDPLDGPSWNQLGYTEALRKNLEGARKALLEYQRLAPKEANPSDSLGDVHYYLGAFHDAEKYYLDAYEKAPAFMGGTDLYKAACARLMTGDVRGADEMFRRYASARRAGQDPVAGYREAEWLYLTGRRTSAAEQMKRFAASTRIPELLSLAASQLAVWDLEAGARQEAAAWAAKAAAAAGSPSSRQLAELCLALSGSAAPQRAPAGALGERAAMLGSLLAKRFADAIPGLKTLVEKSDPLGAERFDVLLAWALVETGHTREAAPLLETYGVPQAGVQDPFAGLSFPRVFQLKGEVLEKQGHPREAAEMRQIFRRLSGS